MPPVLDWGAYLKSTVCLTRGDEAFRRSTSATLTTRVPATLEEAIQALQTIVAVRPRRSSTISTPTSSPRSLAMADRAHPGRRGAAPPCPIAAVLAEHACPTAVLGLALDGYGSRAMDGLHGGELLLGGQGGGFERVGHLSAHADARGDTWQRRGIAASVMHQQVAGDRIAGAFSGQPAAPLAACSTNRTCVPPRPASAGSSTPQRVCWACARR